MAKKRGQSMAERMAARNYASIADSSTGDAAMDSLLSKENRRKTAFAGSMGTTATGMQNPIRRAYNSLAGLFKRRSK